jgi:hypothetical protein
MPMLEYWVVIVLAELANCKGNVGIRLYHCPQEVTNSILIGRSIKCFLIICSLG